MAETIKINEAQLWQRHMDMSQIGSIGNGGVNRQALSAEDITARRVLIDRAVARGYDVKVDAIANLYFIRKGRIDGAPYVATGSHMDSQPQGGRFDGIYGVLAGLEVLEALDEAGEETDHPLLVVAWTNEEGSRFSPGAMGSSVFAGVRDLSDFVDVTDADGVAFSEALEQTLAATPDVPEWESKPQIKAYVEAHIEQGPVLEARKLETGVVTGIQGARMFEIEVSGCAAHAGTAPMATRSDALVATMAMLSDLKAFMDDPEDMIRFTVGRMQVFPNSPNVVPDLVRFTIDLRHPDQSILQSKGDGIGPICRENTGTCGLTIRETFTRNPCIFSEPIVSVIEESARELSLSACQLTSGAFHDALFLADICPTGMIFIPSVGGISHNPAEYSEPAHLAAGTRLLASTMVRLASNDK